ncbi:thioredoxin family protein [Variovorax ginsengisoli]|uniref:Thioredoxin family protein n=1 Tax=Variovorax ginsengisoli TaxID=363844 RepID=A0ABT8SGY4_9BURK|nr:thioredoxin family protein [Variovorax ginsengisoli]MDN8618092.1 thioredoxin family protein [Variovorax ginsengisoli]MDO1537262.1 thioredoxin family protein [Variovorax ginsengisoli]HSC47790.1 thioredoxin family protein [Gammaproteobacteria bacterium]
MPAVNNVGSSDFDAAVAGPGPVLVDFSASWCGPCRAMAPALEKFAASRSDLGVVKVDIDDAPDIAGRYSVRSVPTLALFVEGKPVAAQPGMMSEGQLAQFVDQHMPAAAPRKPVTQDPNRPQVDLDW